MKALFLDKKIACPCVTFPLPQELGANDVRIKIANVGICGSDVHYYLHGKIGGFVVNEPMVLGHEASGTITEIGSAVKNLKVGDRVCMEPGIPDYASRETLQGMYNLDPDVRFWATPPIHGCLRESIVHPANLTFKLPDNVSFEEGALVEPLAIGVHSAKKARVFVPGDTALVLGAGTIGLVTALAAIAAGCSHVIVADSKQEKLDFIRKHYDARISTFNIATGDLKAIGLWQTSARRRHRLRSQRQPAVPSCRPPASSPRRQGRADRHAAGAGADRHRRSADQGNRIPDHLPLRQRL
jgi:D-xylulose reductase